MPTNEELLIKIDDLQKRLDHLSDLYFRINYIDKSVFVNPVHLNGKVSFFGKTPVGIQSAITSPSGGATVDTQARNAIDSIITILQKFITN